MMNSPGLQKSSHSGQLTWEVGGGAEVSEHRLGCDGGGCEGVEESVGSCDQVRGADHGQGGAAVLRWGQQ